LLGCSADVRSNCRREVDIFVVIEYPDDYDNDNDYDYDNDNDDDES
jgi:hypothetical protein